MASRTLHTIRALPAYSGHPALAQHLRACQKLSLPSQPPAHCQYVSPKGHHLHACVLARCQSTSQGPRRGSSPAPKQPPPSIGAVLRKGLDFSATFAMLGKGGFRKLYRDSPGELLLALFA